MYLQAMRELRVALFGDTALAWDIVCAYPSFMAIISQRPLPQIKEAKVHKGRVRWMVAAVYRLQREGAKQLMHAITNGKSLGRWRQREGIPAVTAETLQAAAD